MIVQQISFTAYFNRLDNIESEETYFNRLDNIESEETSLWETVAT